MAYKIYDYWKPTSRKDLITWLKEYYKADVTPFRAETYKTPQLHSIYNRIRAKLAGKV